MGSEGESDEGWGEVKKKNKKPNRSAHVGREVQQPPSWFSQLSPVPAPPATEQSSFEPSMLLLMGLPGSGKSTIAKKLEEIMPWKYVRVNQDDLGSRNACLLRAREVVKVERKCAIIDRCNAGISHRQHFLKLAKELNCPINCVVLDVPRQVCVQRCKSRPDHPTVAAKDAEKVVGFMSKDWEIPSSKENFQNIWRITDSDDDLRRLLLLDEHLQPILLGTEQNEA